MPVGVDPQGLVYDTGTRTGLGCEYDNRSRGGLIKPNNRRNKKALVHTCSDRSFTERQASSYEHLFDWLPSQPTDRGRHMAASVGRSDPSCWSVSLASGLVVEDLRRRSLGHAARNPHPLKNCDNFIYRIMVVPAHKSIIILKIEYLNDLQRPNFGLNWLIMTHRPKRVDHSAILGCPTTHIGR